MPGLDLDLDLRLPSLGLGQVPSPLRAPLPGEQRQSFGKELLERGKSGLGAVLDTLQLPGDYLRGGLAGKLGQRVTGRQLAEHYGVVRPGDRGWGSWGVGLAADIATDPFTYATLGAKHAFTKGGRALMKTGELQGWNRKALLEGFHGTENARLAAGDTAATLRHARDAGERIASPTAESAYQAATGKALSPGSRLSGLARISVPFHPDIGFTLGSGRLARGIGAGLDKVGDKLRFNPLSNMIGAKYSWMRDRATDSTTARAKIATVPLRKELDAISRRKEYNVKASLDEKIRGYGDQYEVPLLRAAAVNLEQASPLAFLDSAKDPAERALFEEFLRKTAPVGKAARKYGEIEKKEAHRAGLNLKDVGDVIAYGPRQATSAKRGGAGAQLEHRTIFPIGSGKNVARKDWLRGYYGGRDRVNDWANRFAGNRDRDAVSNGVLADMVADHHHIRGVTPTPDEMVAYGAKAKEVASAVGAMDPKTYAGKIATHPFFQHDLAGDVARGGSQHARTVEGAGAAIKALASVARRASDFTPGQEFLTAPRALKQLGLKNHYAGNELIGAGPNLYRGLAPKGAGMVDPLVTGGKPFGLHKELGGWGIPLEEFEKVKKSFSGWVLPEELKKPIRIADSATNAFKALSYPIWLSSQVRNAATAALNNLQTGTTFGDYGKQFRLMRGKLPNSLANTMRRDEYGHARIFGEGGPNLELVGQNSGAAMPSARQWSGYTPGTNQYGMGKTGPTGNLAGDTANLLLNEGGAQFGRDVFNKARDWKNAPNPFGLSGVGGRDRDVFAPVVAGRKLSTNIEDFFRGAQYQGLLRQGYAPEMAAREIDRFHFNYKDLTPWEKNVMRRAVPFYTFARKNAPLQLETIATRPGAFSTPFKPSQVNRDQQDYTPDYLSSGFVSPLGPEQNGSRRFLSSLGLPQEEAFKEMALWNGMPDWKRTAEGLAGNMNPLIKGPLEQLAGKQFFSGRDLSELRPTAAARGLAMLAPEGYDQPISQFLGNTPLTRAFTTIDKLMDTKGIGGANARKEWWNTALNLMTGAKVTDVDLDRQRYFDQKNALDRTLESQPHVSQYPSYYVKPEDRKLMTPDEIMQMRMLTQMQAQAREYVAHQRMKAASQ